MMATNLSECHVSNKRTPRALTLPPAKAHPPPKPGRNGRKPKGPVVPLHPSPGPSKAKTQAGRPRPRGAKRAGIKWVWPGPWPPPPPPGPPQATTQAGRPGPGPPTPPTHHPSPELWSMVMSMLGSIISWSGKNTILHVSIFRELV